jgi:hypothetical protein
MSPPTSSEAVHSLLQSEQSILFVSTNQLRSCSPITSKPALSLSLSDKGPVLLLFSNKEKAVFLFQSRKGFIDVSSNETCSSRCLVSLFYPILSHLLMKKYLKACHSIIVLIRNVNETIKNIVF